MKNVKLTLATTLSVLALTFAGTASADGGNRYKNQKQQDEISKSTVKKNISRNTVKQNMVKQNTAKQVNRTKSVKRVVLKQKPTKKVVITKRVVKQSARNKFVAVKPVNQTKKYKQSTNSNNSYKKRVTTKQYVYSVRPGDTLTRISLKTGVSVHKLTRLNRLKYVNSLRIGQRLKLV